MHNEEKGASSGEYTYLLDVWSESSEVRNRGYQWSHKMVTSHQKILQKINHMTLTIDQSNCKPIMTYRENYISLFILYHFCQVHFILYHWYTFSGNLVPQRQTGKGIQGLPTVVWGWQMFTYHPGGVSGRLWWLQMFCTQCTWSGWEQVSFSCWT